jgi:hypothetical protein
MGLRLLGSGAIALRNAGSGLNILRGEIQFQGNRY